MSHARRPYPVSQMLLLAAVVAALVSGGVLLLWLLTREPNLEPATIVETTRAV
jgi:hypothetical protein